MRSTAVVSPMVKIDRSGVHCPPLTFSINRRIKSNQKSKPISPKQSQDSTVVTKSTNRCLAQLTHNNNLHKSKTNHGRTKQGEQNKQHKTRVHGVFWFFFSEVFSTPKTTQVFLQRGKIARSSDRRSSVRSKGSSRSEVRFLDVARSRSGSLDGGAPWRRPWLRAEKLAVACFGSPPFFLSSSSFTLLYSSSWGFFFFLFCVVIINISVLLCLALASGPFGVQ